MFNWDSKKSNWFYSRRYSELKVAKYWGLTPFQWDGESEESKAEMIAFYGTENKIATYEKHLREIRGKNRTGRGIRR